MDAEMTAFQDTFREEAEEYLGRLTGGLLKLERNPSDEAALREMLLTAHTLKGSAAMVGLPVPSTLAHAMEDVLASLRDTRRELEPMTADRLFLAFDMLHALIKPAPSTAGVADAAFRQLVLDLRSCVGSGEAAASPPPAAAETSYAPTVLLVEESVIVRELEKALLEDAGFHVEAINDGREALRLATGGHYDLIISGMETRGMRGPELAISVRHALDGKAPPVILMSSEGEPVRERELCAVSYTH
jgi:chemotaxis protein histidine kinase CheA